LRQIPYLNNIPHPFRARLLIKAKFYGMSNLEAAAGTVLRCKLLETGNFDDYDAVGEAILPS